MLQNQAQSGYEVKIHRKERRIHPVNMQMTEGRGRVAFSGASGVLGSALMRRVRALELPILQLVRREPAGPEEVRWNPEATPVLGDSAPLEGLSAAVHFSGANVAARRWTAEYRREMTKSRVGTTAALARVLAGLQCPPKAWLVASAIGFYGDRGEEYLDEQAPAGKGFLAELCQQWEAATRVAEEAGIRVVHLRLGVVLGPGGGALERMLPLFRAGLGGRLGNGRQWMSWISLDDAVEAMLFALETPGLSGPVNMTAPSPVTNAEFTRVLGMQLRRPAMLPVPAFALRLALGQMAEETLLASARVFPGKLTAAGFQFRHAALKDALAAALQ